MKKRERKLKLDRVSFRIAKAELNLFSLGKNWFVLQIEINDFNLQIWLVFSYLNKCHKLFQEKKMCADINTKKEKYSRL